MWRRIDTAPFGEDLELAVLDDGETHSLTFPCRRSLRGWVGALSYEFVDVHPTHWRPWEERDIS